MKKYTVSLFLLLLSTGYLNTMDDSPQSMFLALPSDIIRQFVAQVSGKTKNALRLTCHALHQIASFMYKDTLIQHPEIKLETIEKQLLLYEYVVQNNPDMVRYMFSLGATYQLDVFDPLVDLPFPHSGNDDMLARESSVQHKSFPKNRIPTMYLKKKQTLLHIAIDLGHAEVVKLLLEHLQNILLRINETSISLCAQPELNPIKIAQNAWYRITVLNQIRNFIQSRDSDDMTVFHRAALNNNEDIMLLLLNYDISKPHSNIKNNMGNTPLTIAQDNRYTGIEQQLLAYLNSNQAKQ